IWAWTRWSSARSPATWSSIRTRCCSASPPGSGSRPPSNGPSTRSTDPGPPGRRPARDRRNIVRHNICAAWFAAVLAQAPQGWVGTEAVISEAEDVDDIADLMREAAVESYGDPVVLLVEEDDEWFAVVRVDGEGDPRAFVSAARGDGLGALLRELVGEVPD